MLPQSKQYAIDDTSRVGLLWDLFFGVSGGLLGGYLFDVLNISLGGTIGQLGTAVVGAVVVLWIASFFRK